MCGRFTLFLDAETLQDEFGLAEVQPEYGPHYNLAPTQPVAVITNAQNRRMDFMRWGLVPYWAKDPSIGSKMINARSETIQEKPSFKNAFQKRRCLIPADGFYEWLRGVPGKSTSTPFYFHLANRGPFAFAGLWEFWKSPEGEELRTCTIITTSANELVAKVHERMPVILTGDNMNAWLLPAPSDQLMALLKPYPPELMASYPVSRAVNSPDRDSPELVAPLVN
jgi:putative SOS response-associated peptidase YedK